MSDLSNYLENALVNHIVRNTPYTPPATVYLALFTGVSNAEAGTGTEVSTSGTGYARKVVTFAAPSDGGAVNSAAVTFDEATASWGTVTHHALFDAPTGGNALTAIKALPAATPVAAGNVLEYKAGDISFALA